MRDPARHIAKIDMTLLSRYYERYADHAVSVANRPVFLATGERRVVTCDAGAHMDGRRTRLPIRSVPLWENR